MDIEKYRAFLAVMECGSFTAASKKLGLTQSGVSHAVSSLEKELGFPLLRRSRVGIRPTEEGEKLLLPVKNVLRGCEELCQTAAGIRGLNLGTIHVGAFTSVTASWMPGIINEFRERYPAVEFQLLAGNRLEVQNWLQDGSADVGFVTLPYGFDGCIPLRVERLLAVLPKNHRFADYPYFPLYEFPNEDYIAITALSAPLDILQSFSKISVRPNIRYTTDDASAAVAMVRNGLGITVLPEMLLEGCAGDVEIMELAPKIRFTIALAVPKASAGSPVVQKFTECVREWLDRKYNSQT
jgi:DNA-binding transcriptional LysR family regulator